ncbi:MAG TPA: hypothetical protein VM888_07245 [Chitinophagaceae bacterium]|jgi:hypothetical protein|nr:hypothetical protein [Chitinophagaceae bacterium]
MKNHKRDLLVLLNAANLGDALEKEIECLHTLLMQVECNEAFCTAHELVTRLKITRKKKAILKSIQTSQLKAFHFLINRN